MEQDTKEVIGRITLERLAQYTVGDGTSHDRMALFPVFLPGHNGTAGDYCTLDEAIAGGWAELVEQARDTVPELVLRNTGQRMVLVLDGEEIVGGRQNRIVNASFLVAPGSEVVLPVSCVEHGRWHEVSQRFVPGEVSFFDLKRQKCQQVNVSLREHGRASADQNAIWNHLARRHAAAKTASPTGAMRDLYSEREEALLGYERAFPYSEGSAGLITAIGGRSINPAPRQRSGASSCAATRWTP